MKRLFNYMFLMMTAATLAFTGCTQEEIVFDHEQPQFEIDAEAILLEVIAPTGTSSEEVLYITGPFSGDKMIRLTKAEKSDKKWGVYLYESDFVEGKSLEDGFYFYSETNLEERSAVGDSVMHTLKNVAYGTRTNVWVASWAKFFENGEKPIEHDGYAVFFINEIPDWDAITLYAWGSVEAFGGWPGAAPMGRETINGLTFQYIDFGADNEGEDLNLIFSNNGANQLGDYNFIVNDNLYLKITADGVQPFNPFSDDVWPTHTHDGDAVYFCNNAGWENVRLYMWGATNDLNGGWPGMEPTGTFTFKGYDWYYFDLGAANEGQEEHLIVNNGDGTQIDDIVVYTLTGGDSIFYFFLENKTVTRIEDPLTYEYPSLEPDPDPTPGEKDTVYITVTDTITTHLYFIDETADMHYVYTYGDDVTLFGGWPGADWTAWQTATFFGQQLYCYEFDQPRGLVVNGIINNNNGTQIEPAFKFYVGDQTEYFFLIEDETVTELNPSPEKAAAIRRMFHK